MSFFTNHPPIGRGRREDFLRASERSYESSVVAAENKDGKIEGFSN
jgi:hypothetical protein